MHGCCQQYSAVATVLLDGPLTQSVELELVIWQSCSTQVLQQYTTLVHQVLQQYESLVHQVLQQYKTLLHQVLQQYKSLVHEHALMCCAGCSPACPILWRSGTSQFC